MIGLEIKINGEKIAVLGGENIEFITSWIEAIGNFNSKDEFNCWLTASGQSITGSKTFDSHQWFRQHKINVNDEVSFRFVETDTFAVAENVIPKIKYTAEENATRIKDAIKRAKAKLKDDEL